MDVPRSGASFRIMDAAGKDITNDAQGIRIRDELDLLVEMMGLNRIAPGRFSWLLVLTIWAGWKAGTVDPAVIAHEIRGCPR